MCLIAQLVYLERTFTPISGKIRCLSGLGDESELSLGEGVCAVLEFMNAARCSILVASSSQVPGKTPLGILPSISLFTGH